MPIVPLKLISGVNADYTPSLNQAGVSSCNLIRWKDKLPQKLGGWDKFYPFTLSGIPREIRGWADLNAANHLAVATTLQVVVITDGVIQDITPQTLVTNYITNFGTTTGSNVVSVADGNVTNVTIYDSIFFNTPVSVAGIILAGLYQIQAITGPNNFQIFAASNANATVTAGGLVPIFTTTGGSAVVSVAFADHGLSVGDVFTFPIVTRGAGVTILGSYPVVTVPSSGTFTIQAATQATANASFSMNVSGLSQLRYFITLGPAALGVGYGLGAYGAGAYGSGVVPTVQTGLPLSATDWTMDNWGEILLSNPYGGGIFFWRPNSGFQNSTIISSGPTFNNGIFVSMPQQILVAWGSTINGQQQDPLIVRWSDQQDFENWTVSSQTQAGSFRIPTGSMIIAGYQGPQQGLIWTDLDLYAMQYLGPPFVFGFNKLSSGCGLIGPHAKTSMRGNVYWMTGGSFFVLSGNGVNQIPCSVWDIVFQDLDEVNQWKIVAAANSQFDEVAFYYPSISGGTGENDKYVKINVQDGSWDYGILSRSSWIDQSVLGQAIGTTPTGIVYQHETSNDADGQPLNATFTTGYFVLAEGQDLVFADWLFPDMKWGYFNGTQNAVVSVTITCVEYPNADPQTFGPFQISNAVDYINMRLRGRQISLTFSSNDIGSFWRLGQIRIRIAKAGRR